MTTAHKPRRIRSDGWTLPRQRLFIKMLAATGSVEKAANSAGMSASSAYRLRSHPDAAAFRDAWTAALAACATRRRDLALDSAINGAVRSVYENGVCVWREALVNDRLLMFLLRRHDKPTRRSREPRDTPRAGPASAEPSDAHERGSAEKLRFNANVSSPDN